MTRNDFIQQAVLAVLHAGSNSSLAVATAVAAADTLEQHGVTWSTQDSCVDVVAAIRNPNSNLSKAMAQHLTVERRRQ